LFLQNSQQQSSGWGILFSLVGFRIVRSGVQVFDGRVPAMIAPFQLDVMRAHRDALGLGKPQEPSAHYAKQLPEIVTFRSVRKVARTHKPTAD